MEWRTVLEALEARLAELARGGIQFLNVASDPDSPRAGTVMSMDNGLSVHVYLELDGADGTDSASTSSLAR